jgi:antitoxin VapB
MSELETKLARITQLLDQHHLDALYLARISSFAWATCGAAAYINTATTTGEASLLITRHGRYVVTNNIEAPHYDKEEKLKEQGWEIEAGPWFLPSDAIEKHAGGLKLGADICMPGAVDLSNELAELRMNLLPEEQARYREVSQLSAQALEAAARATHPGMDEYEIAALLAQETYSRGLTPIVDLIATDERIYNFRHPLPYRGKKMEKYAMLVLCGRRYGLVTSVTRLVHFGPLPDELKKKQAAVAHIDAHVITGTRPGATLSDMFTKIQQAYAAAGYPDEYRLHHQGGSAGYEAREFLCKPGVDVKVAAGQAYAWNPSITGCKVEDTVLIHADGFEIMTEMPGWPTTDVVVDGKTIRRPAILER